MAVCTALQDPYLKSALNSGAFQAAGGGHPEALAEASTQSISDLLKQTLSSRDVAGQAYRGGLF